MSLPLLLAACRAPDDVSDTAIDGIPDSFERRLSAEAHAIAPVPGGGFRAAQPLMGLEALFSADGAAFDGIRLRTVGVGRDTGTAAVASVAPALGDCQSLTDLDPQDTCIARLEYARDGLLEWWGSRPGAIQVGWDLAEPPPGDGPVVIELAVDGAEIQSGSDERSVALLTPDRRLEFSDLRAWDDAGRPLEAWMELEGQRLRMVVDATDAAWPIHLDPVTLSASWTATGSSSSYFGWSIASAGDVNNDGYDDIVVGAPYYSSYTGRAYVYLGSSSGPASSASTTLTGSTSYQYLGYDVAGAGDVNNDGCADVIVGMPGYSSYYGGASVYHGASTGLSSSASRTITGPSSGYLGISVSGAGDVNRDGYDDVIVGAYGYSSYAGRAYVHHGSSSGVASSATTTMSGLSSSYFGGAVGAAGDVNGDTYDDVIVGAYAYSSSTGYVAIHHGSGSGVSSSAARTLSGSTSGEYFGQAVAGAGDVNGDGYDDVIVGAPYYSSYYGRAAVYHGGGSGIAASATTSLTGLSSSYYGWSVAGGDLDADGYDDVVVGAYGYSSTAGLVRTYHGSSAGISSAHEGTVTGASSTGLGRSVAIADVNGDGRGDVLAGGHAYSSYAGYAAVYYAQTDADGDGYNAGTGASDDCDDTDGSINPGAAETTGDGIDSDCDGAETCYDDDDDDGYLDTTRDTRSSSDADCDDAYEGPLTDPTTDCDDADAGDHPGGTEITGNGDDEDCNGAELCYDDDDNDGYLDTTGDTRVSADTDCSDASEGLSTDPVTDCNDASASVFPGATETVGDGTDGNCDGAETCYDDDDDDGYLDTSSDTRASTDADCGDAYEGLRSDPTTDCDDADAGDHPGATEIAGNGDDEDCNGAELCYDDDDDDGWLDTSGDTRVSGDTDCADSNEGLATDPTTDCDDSLATRNPGATEIVGDGIDQDCDAGDVCHDDGDRDGFGSSATIASGDLDCTDAGESLVATDCDDGSATVWPAAPEVVGDGIDQDCDDGDLCYADGDGDAHGGSVTVASVDIDCADAGEAGAATDCDDASSAVHPGSAEITADAVDQDCDGGDVCYVDADGDSYGTAATAAGADLDCVDAGEASLASDCDDADASIRPAGPEIPLDGIDQDCDGGDACYADADADGHGGTTLIASADTDCVDGGEATTATDCDDADRFAYPGASESVADGIDQDCDGADVCFRDADLDGYGTPTLAAGVDLSCATAGVSSRYDDCDDASATAFPGAPEVVADDVDQDCDGREACYEDRDGDGEGSGTTVVSADATCDAVGESLTATDCDDGDATVNAAAVETPGSGADEDCDGSELCYVDVDQDGYGSAETTASASVDCAGASSVGTDCDDGDVAVYPGADEGIADGADGDCDGVEICFRDDDGDGHGTTATTVSESLACDGAASLDDDCDDADAAVHPAADEIPADAIDADCDGGDACFADADGDGFGGETTVASPDLSCAEAGEAINAADCDDESPAANPAVAEECNGADDNCDGAVDEGLADCDPGSKAACGCATPGTGPGSLAPLGGLLLLAARRRRHRP